jgi:hypothetical protein
MSDHIYNNEFYDRLMQGSLTSAQIYLGYLFGRWLPSSVIDLGCGRGEWLAVCKELGVKRLVGLDGNWVSQEMMLDPAIEFRSANLSESLPVEKRYDLALSLEVAEHLPPEASDRFITNLAGLSDAVLFSAHSSPSLAPTTSTRAFIVSGQKNFSSEVIWSSTFSDRNSGAMIGRGPGIDKTLSSMSSRTIRCLVH